MTIFTKEKLNTLNCESPGCTHEGHERIYLTPRCHQSRAVVASYHRTRGTLLIQCSVCKRIVAEIAVGNAHENLVDRDMADAVNRH